MGKMEQDDQDFAFIREKIKDKPINRRRLLINGLWTIIFAVVFGAVVCFVFVLLEPIMKEWLYPQEDPTVMIPEDEEPDENDTKEEDTDPEKEEDTQPVQHVTEIQKLEVEDFQELQNKLYAIGKSANKAVVTVTGVKNNLDIFYNTYEDKHQTSGIIFSSTEQELLILANKSSIEDVDKINVTFINDDIVSGTLKKYDGNTGIAIISVDRDDVSEETLNKIEVAELGNSQAINQGTVVIAIGSPQGRNYSILNGTVTSSGNFVSTYDSNYKILTTNINGNKEGNGVLINLKGQIIGVIMQQYGSEGDQSTITALSISELKSVIRALSNNKSIPYLGLKVSTVTEEIAAAYEIPKGVYINSVAMESPGMRAGLQDADVIIKLNDVEITTAEQYTEVLMEMEPDTSIIVTVMRQNGEIYSEIECPAVLGELP